MNAVGKPPKQKRLVLAPETLFIFNANSFVIDRKRDKKKKKEKEKKEKKENSANIK